MGKFRLRSRTELNTYKKWLSFYFYLLLKFHPKNPIPQTITITLRMMNMFCSIVPVTSIATQTGNNTGYDGYLLDETGFQMEIKELLNQARNIWGEQKHSLSQIIVRLGKVFGDICKYERDDFGDRPNSNDQELKKELGNVIFSTIRWCDDLGYDPEECIELAKECQQKYQERLKE